MTMPIVRPRTGAPACAAIAALLLYVSAARSQVPYNSGELQVALNKLTVLGSVLYIAAHPDDENTAFLSAMANGGLYRTGYLAITRGEGGQNLLGPEQGDALGVIRTQELIGARRIDGAEQFFTRAIDFGYSKSTDETLEFWGKEEILSDVVRVIRTFRPDVIVSRFTPDRGGHGNHTASALLAQEAFRAAADPSRFPEQLRTLKPHQAKRLVWNVFRFSRSAGEQPSVASVVQELGAYSPLLGLSFGELAGKSRSMHKSQGFGALELRGSWTNAFEHVDGDTARQSLFDGIETSWSRVPGGASIGELLKKAALDFDPGDPAKVLPLLLDAINDMDSRPAHDWIRHKRNELKNVILACSGIWLEAVSAGYRVNGGSQLSVTARVLNRSSADLTVKRVGMSLLAADTVVNKRAEPNVPLEVRLTAPVPESHAFTQPYWLVRDKAFGRYSVEDPALIGLPESPPALFVTVWLGFASRSFPYEVPVRFRWVDPTGGEQTRPVGVVPLASIAIKDPVVVSLRGAETSLGVVVSPIRPGIRGTLRLELPKGWTASPGAQTIVCDSTLSDRTAIFRLTPGNGAADGTVRAVLESEGRSASHTLVSISYPHIEPQTYLEPAEAKLLVLDLAASGSRVGYIAGSGDGIAQILSKIGYQVELLSDDDIETGDLSVYDAIVTGVRAHNTRPVLFRSYERLMQYVAGGGRYIVQYVTRQQLPSASLGPWPLVISNERVSVEAAPVTLPNPEHPLLVLPNRISQHDFEGWVQERGLYFASSWDARYDTVLVSADPGEPPHAGGLLYGRYGKGYFIYTGYSWFRQLPAGVPGAFRLFVNLLSQETGR